MLFGWARLSTKGPSTMPKMIWITTSGTAMNRRDHSATIGARTAASPMRTSVGMAVSIMRRLFALSPPAVARRATSGAHATRQVRGTGDLEGLTGPGRWGSMADLLASGVCT